MSEYTPTMDDTTLIELEEAFGWVHPDDAGAQPKDRAHLVRLGQLLMLGVAVMLVVIGALAVLELVTGLLDDLALGTPPQ